MIASSAASPDRRRVVISCLVLLAFAVRLAVALILPEQSASLPDAIAYRQAAEHLRNTLQVGTPFFMPLYPALLALTGPGLGQLLLDTMLSAALVWLVFELTIALFNDVATALVAALITTAYPHFIFFAAVGLTETLFMTLTVAALVCWYRSHFIGAAILAVLSILTRPVIDSLVPLLVVYFAFAIHRFHIWGVVRQLLIFIAIYCAMMSPWWFHNYRAYGTFVRLNLGSGIALYSGNNPMNQSGGQDRDLDSHMQSFALITDPLEQDRELHQAAFNYIRDNPSGFLARAGLKFLRFWRLWPYAESYSRVTYIAMSFLSFTPVLLLAIIYLILRGRRDIRIVAPILLFGGYLTCVHMIVPGSIRYRIPLEPFLIALAAAALTEIAAKNARCRAVIYALRTRL